MSQAIKLIKESEARWIDLRFTDTRGKEQHVSFPSKDVDDEFFQVGKMFDGSSIEGWKGINESDMILMPDDATAVLDPFTDEPTVIIRCDIIEPSTMQSYDRDPRSVAKRAEGYLASTGLGDTAFFGPEPEFFVFDDVKWGSNINGCFHKVNSEEGNGHLDQNSRMEIWGIGLVSKVGIFRCLLLIAYMIYELRCVRLWRRWA